MTIISLKKKKKKLTLLLQKKVFFISVIVSFFINKIGEACCKKCASLLYWLLVNPLLSGKTPQNIGLSLHLIYSFCPSITWCYSKFFVVWDLAELSTAHVLEACQNEKAARRPNWMLSAEKNQGLPFVLPPRCWESKSCWDSDGSGSWVLY